LADVQDKSWTPKYNNLMKYPFKITINDQQRAEQIKDDVQIGHYFVFVKHKKATSVERLKRLSVKKYFKNNVLPLVNQAVKLDGVTITPQHRDIDPIACVVTDRNLYHADQDTVRFFIAFPAPPEDLRLTINCNGEMFSERLVKLTDGVGIETVSMLPPGSYEAQLSIADRHICVPVSFTVTEDHLTPLSAQLIKHKFKEETATFLFELGVESYQMPFEGKLIVTLIEQGLEVADTIPKAVTPGYYVGRIPMSGSGPFSLRVTVDAKRVTEVPIPGTTPQVFEDKTSVINELGEEKIFSMISEAKALPLRGGYLMEGDFFATPLIVEEIVTNERLIQVNTDVESLVLVNLDLTSGQYVIQEEGNVTAGNTITVRTDSPFCTVFVGGFVNEQAFEAYTTFIKPQTFQLSVETPKSIRPHTDLVVRLKGLVDKTIPVLLCVRDEGITDKPEVSLAAAAKRSIDTATEGMDERAFSTMEELLNDSSYLMVTSDEDDIIDINSELNVHADLAQWLLDQGETDTAHSLLTESLTKGNLAEKARAEEMLQTISGTETTHTAVAKKFAIPLVALESVELNPEVIKLLDEKLLRKHQVLPLFKRDHCLFVALSDPTNAELVLNEIQSHTDMQIEAILVDADKFESFIERALEFDLSHEDEILEHLELDEREKISKADSDDFSNSFVETLNEESSEEDELSNSLETFSLDSDSEYEYFSGDTVPEDESGEDEFSHYLETFSQEDEVSEKEQLSPEEELSQYLDELSSGEYLSSDEDLTQYLDTFSIDEENKTEPGKGSQTNAIESQYIEYKNVLYYKLINLNESADIVIPLGDSQGSLTVETFAMTKGEWTQTHTTVKVEQPVRIDLALPPFVCPDDKIVGHLSAITSSPKAVISLTHNGNTVALYNGNLIDALSIENQANLEFYVQPGTYIAKIEDSLTGERDSIELVVNDMGRFKLYPKALSLLFKDESIDSREVLRLLPSIDTFFNRLITATANNTHLSCEATAAKILAATFMYLSAENDEQRSTAEQIILMGVAHERKMIRPGQGFAVYPESEEMSEFLSRSTVRYLWHLKELDEVSDISRPLRKAVRQGLSLAEQAAQAHQMQLLPEKIHSIEEAYTIASVGKNTTEVKQFIENMIDFKTARLKKSQDTVADRTKLAYAAASLIAMGDLEPGIKLANQVTRQLNEQGRLYSTMDSVAMIALMIQLRMSGIGEARVRVNGQEMSASEVAFAEAPIESIEVLEGIAAVEVTRVHEENWDSYADNFPVNIDFRNASDMIVEQVGAGDSIDLVVSLPAGYQTGDMVQVALPSSLSWIKGDSKVKCLTLDFEGRDKLRIPLIVTSPIEGQQHFALCVRNLYEEERVASARYALHS